MARTRDPSKHPGAPAVRPVTVGIPLRSRRNTPDWATTCDLLAQTLRSVAAQSVPCARVIVVCHERPAVAIPDGLEVQFHEVSFDPPARPIEGWIDARRKQFAIGAHLREHGGGRLFLLDADDLIDDRLLATVDRSEAKAILLRTGYQFDETRGKVTLMPRMWRRCGSCAVVDWRSDELPDSREESGDSVYRQFNDTRHYDWPLQFKAWGWPTASIYRPLVLYVVNHGQNISATYASARWRLFNRFAPAMRMTPSLRGHFAMGA